MKLSLFTFLIGSLLIAVASADNSDGSKIINKLDDNDKDKIEDKLDSLDQLKEDLQDCMDDSDNRRELINCVKGFLDDANYKDLSDDDEDAIMEATLKFARDYFDEQDNNDREERENNRDNDSDDDRDRDNDRDKSRDNDKNDSDEDRDRDNDRDESREKDDKDDGSNKNKSRGSRKARKLLRSKNY